MSRYQKGKANLKQETVSGSGISWAVCKSARRSRQITTPARHHSVFLQTGCLSCRPTNSVKALKATVLRIEPVMNSFVQMIGALRGTAPITMLVKTSSLEKNGKKCKNATRVINRFVRVPPLLNGAGGAK